MHCTALRLTPSPSPLPPARLPARRNPAQQLRACYRLIAKMPTLAAMAYKTSIGQPIIYPRNDLNYAENFLHMMFAGECVRARAGTRLVAPVWKAWARLPGGKQERFSQGRTCGGTCMPAGHNISRPPFPPSPSPTNPPYHHLALPAVPSERYEVDPELAKALEIIFILHLDHEQNASTSTVRTAGSSQANPFACVASGIAALWGPAHGGANEAVLKMLEEIDHLGGVPAIPTMVARAKDKSDPFRLMGFGHRVYKVRCGEVAEGGWQRRWQKGGRRGGGWGDGAVRGDLARGMLPLIRAAV